MSKTIRVYLVVAVGAVVGLYVGVYVLEQPLVGVLIAAIALIGGLYLLRKESEDDGDFFAAPDDDEDEADEPPARSTKSKASPKTTKASTTVVEEETSKPSSKAAEPLAAWEGEGLTPWSPPEDDADSPAASTSLLDRRPEREREPEPEVEEELDLLDLEELDHIDEFVEAETEAASLDKATAIEDDDELADAMLDEFHAMEIDEIEDVHSDDDIMKASHATELSVTAPAQAADNSELAKLLAKVQSRLAAYE